MIRGKTTTIIRAWVVGTLAICVTDAWLALINVCKAKTNWKDKNDLLRPCNCFETDIHNTIRALFGKEI